MDGYDTTPLSPEQAAKLHVLLTDSHKEFGTKDWYPELMALNGGWEKFVFVCRRTVRRYNYRSDKDLFSHVHTVFSMQHRRGQLANGTQFLRFTISSDAHDLYREVEKQFRHKDWFRDLTANLNHGRHHELLTKCQETLNNHPDRTVPQLAMTINCRMDKAWRRRRKDS